MREPATISRRRLLQTGLGAATMAAAAPLLAAPGITPAQIEGPFFPIRDQADKDIDLTRIEGHANRARGEVIEIGGQVLDADGQPIAGALVDVWQANAHGRYAHEADPNPAPLDPDFQGWARFTTDAEGRWRIRTIKPGAYPVRDGWARPPHIHFKVARRGYRELTTQMYFAGDPLNDADRLLLEVPADQRGRLLVAFSAGDADRPPQGRFDLVLQAV
jgi:protocatechuate 3,4-dioxygenase, beta subunit